MFWGTQGKKRLRSWELFGIIDVPGTTQEKNGSAHRPSNLSYEENERKASVGGDKEDEREATWCSYSADSGFVRSKLGQESGTGISAEKSWGAVPRWP